MVVKIWSKGHLKAEGHFWFGHQDLGLGPLRLVVICTVVYILTIGEKNPGNLFV